jgi:chromosome segregation ATPase
MSIEGIQEVIRKLRNIELRRAVHGVDAAQVRDLLGEAADTLASAAREQTELRDDLKRLQAESDASAIGAALLAATRAGEGVMAEAREKAETLSTQAEAQASALLARVKTQAEKRAQKTNAAREQFERELTAAKEAHAKELESARLEAETALADARRELAQLENNAARLRSFVAEMERHIVDTARETLQELEAFSAAPRRTTEGDLLTELRPRRPEPFQATPTR